MFVLTILRNNLLAVFRPRPLVRSFFACALRGSGWRAMLYGLGLIGAVSTGLLMLPSSVQAELNQGLTAAGWSEFTFDEKRANRFIQLADTPDVIQIDTDNSVSIAYLPFSGQPVNLNRTPYLSFSWRRLGPAVDTDLTRKGGDDRTLAVYVAFPYQPERASFKERLLRPFVEASEGASAPGRVLTYLWGGGARRGTWFENPYTGKAGWMQILQLPSDEAEVWFTHQLDIRADFIDRFGYPLPNPSYIAIAADSDDTKGMFSAQVKALGFTG